MTRTEYHEKLLDNIEGCFSTLRDRAAEWDSFDHFEQTEYLFAFDDAGRYLEELRGARDLNELVRTGLDRLAQLEQEYVAVQGLVEDLESRLRTPPLPGRECDTRDSQIRGEAA